MNNISYSTKYATWHTINKGDTILLSNNNLNYSSIGTSSVGVSTVGSNVGKWYWEITLTQVATAQHYPYFGICNYNPTGSNTISLGYTAESVGITNTIYYSYLSLGFQTQSASFSMLQNDVFGFALDLSSLSGTPKPYQLFFYRNGTQLATFSFALNYWRAACTSDNNAGQTYQTNFGLTPFSYSVPAGFNSGLFVPNYSYLYKPTSNATLNSNLNVTTHIGQVIGKYPKSSGKWYWEVTVNSGTSSLSIGIAGVTFSVTTNLLIGSNNSWVYTVYYNTAFWSIKDTGTGYSAYGSVYGPGDCIGVALDMDGGNLTMYKNGVSQGVMYSGLTGPMVPIVGNYIAIDYFYATYTVNFGQTPFAYAVPNGYIAGLYL